MNAAEQDSFGARPSNRIDNSQIEADGDTWQENLAVCEAAPTSPDAGKLVIRSYYQSSRSGKRVWDEPPSGASNIRPAPEEMRRMAKLQLTELQVATGHVQDLIPDEAMPKKEKKRGGLFRFKKKDKAKQQQLQLQQQQQQQQAGRKIQYKNGSKLFAKKGTPRRKQNDNNDAHLQLAIARSLAEANGEEYDSGLPQNQPYSTTLPYSGTDDEELAIAKALSMSAIEPPPESEDDILKRVLEQSKQEAAAPKKKGHPREEDLLGLTPPPAIHNAARVWPEDDRKMQAKPAAAPVVPLMNQLPVSSSYAAASPAFASISPQSSYAAYSQSPPREAHLQYSTPPRAALKSPPSTASPQKSPSAMFDPYAKDAPAPKAKSKPLVRKDSGGPKLQKMDEGQVGTNSKKLSFGKRKKTTEKMQDKAGLV